MFTKVILNLSCVALLAGSSMALASERYADGREVGLELFQNDFTKQKQLLESLSVPALVMFWPKESAELAEKYSDALMGAIAKGSVNALTLAFKSQYWQDKKNVRVYPITKEHPLGQDPFYTPLLSLLNSPEILAQEVFSFYLIGCITYRGERMAQASSKYRDVRRDLENRDSGLRLPDINPSEHPLYQSYIDAEKKIVLVDKWRDLLKDEMIAATSKVWPLASAEFINDLCEKIETFADVMEAECRKNLSPAQKVLVYGLAQDYRDSKALRNADEIKALLNRIANPSGDEDKVLRDRFLTIMTK